LDFAVNLNVTQVSSIVHSIQIHEYHWINWKYIQSCLPWNEWLWRRSTKSWNQHQQIYLKCSIKSQIQRIPFGFIEWHSNAKIGFLEYFLFPATRVRPSELQWAFDIVKPFGISGNKQGSLDVTDRQCIVIQFVLLKRHPDQKISIHVQNIDGKAAYSYVMVFR
jgi:hypothetical protein